MMRCWSTGMPSLDITSAFTRATLSDGRTSSVDVLPVSVFTKICIVPPVCAYCAATAAGFGLPSSSTSMSPLTSASCTPSHFSAPMLDTVANAFMSTSYDGAAITTGPLPPATVMMCTGIAAAAAVPPALATSPAPAPAAPPPPPAAAPPPPPPPGVEEMLRR